MIWIEFALRVEGKCPSRGQAVLADEFLMIDLREYTRGFLCEGLFLPLLGDSTLVDFSEAFLVLELLQITEGNRGVVVLVHKNPCEELSSQGVFEFQLKVLGYSEALRIGLDGMGEKRKQKEREEEIQNQVLKHLGTNIEQVVQVINKVLQFVYSLLFTRFQGDELEGMGEEFKENLVERKLSHPLGQLLTVPLEEIQERVQRGDSHQLFLISQKPADRLEERKGTLTGAEELKREVPAQVHDTLQHVDVVEDNIFASEVELQKENSAEVGTGENVVEMSRVLQVRYEFGEGFDQLDLRLRGQSLGTEMAECLEDEFLGEEVEKNRALLFPPKNYFQNID